MFHPSEVAHWFATWFNRPSRVPSEAPFWQLYEHEGRVLEHAPARLAQRSTTELLIVITTYRRPAPCAAVISALADALHRTPWGGTRGSQVVLVLNDQSDADYGAVRELARARFGADLVWLDARRRLGKPGFWRAYQAAFCAALRLAPRHALFLQDDLEFAPDLFVQLRAHWQATAHDPRRRVLYLFSSEEDERWGRWILFRRRDAAAGLRWTQWFDLQAFYVDRAFFELLQYAVIPMHRYRWRRRPDVSSGVGWQLTVRLQREGHIYQAYPPLVRHGMHASQMNPAARARRALDNRGLLDFDGKPTT